MVSIFDFVIIALNVDDIVWFSRNTKMLEEEKLALAKRFKVEVDLHYILGMYVKRDRRSRTLSMTQKKYLEGVLKRFDMENGKQYPFHSIKEESLSPYDKKKNLLMSRHIK